VTVGHTGSMTGQEPQAVQAQARLLSLQQREVVQLQRQWS